MNDLTKASALAQTSATEKVLNAHEFLLAFLAKFDDAKRGGIHDFIEISMFNMINLAVDNIDKYMQKGHLNIDGNQIMQITVDAYQNVLDGIKRNLDNVGKVGFR